MVAASFDGQSFAGYRLPEEMDVVNISFFFRTTKQNGLFLYMAADDNHRFLAVAIHRGRITVRGKLSNDYPIYLDSQMSQLDNNVWHKVSNLRGK